MVSWREFVHYAGIDGIRLLLGRHEGGAMDHDQTRRVAFVGTDSRRDAGELWQLLL